MRRFTFTIVLVIAVGWGPAAWADDQFRARELAVRVLGVSKIGVTATARNYAPKELEGRLLERLMQDMTAKTYFEPQTIDGLFNLKTRRADLAAASKKAKTDGVLVLEIGLEEIKGYLASSSGRRIRSFKFRYLVGELEEKNVVSILADRIIEGLVLAVPYRGFVTSVENSPEKSPEKSTAKVNLGSNHGVKDGDVLELFEFRWPDFNAPRRRLANVEVRKVLGPDESEVVLVKTASRSDRLELYAKVDFSLVKSTPQGPPVIEATDSSVVTGKWWFGFGGELDSFGPESVAVQYESRVIQVNGAPFGYLAAGNDVLALRAAFGSAKSTSETIAFFDGQGTYAIYQQGGAQSAWTLSAGARVLLSQVTPNPSTVSALSTTTVISPMAELKYQFVPRRRIRLVGTTEIFWPVYSEGAAIGSLPFAFGIGLGGALQLAISSKFGLEVFGKQRYIRRLIDGQNGIQERQTLLGAGIIVSF